MKNSDAIRSFLNEYRRYVREVLEPAYEELKSLFRLWENPGYWSKYASKNRLPAPSPIHHTRTRIKRPESVVDKIIRNPARYPAQLSLESLKKMDDALGGRIVVPFLSDLPLIDRELQHSEQLEISRESLPVAYLNKDLLLRLGLTHLAEQSKESGYTAIHYVVRARESAIAEAERPRIEIQVRTLVGDLWAEIEHILGYKPGKHTSFAVRKQFQILASQLTTIDEHFNFLYTELSRFQEIVAYEEFHPLNPENLPAVLNEIGVSCAQKEIDILLKILASRGIFLVGDLLSEGTPGRIETIRNVFLGHKGQLPTNFETIATLATLKDIRDENAMVESIKARIGLGDAWENLKKGLLASGLEKTGGAIDENHIKT